MDITDKKLIPYRVERIIVDGNEYKTVTRNGLAMIPYTDILIDYQDRSVSGDDNAHYLCKFLNYLYEENGISFLAEVKKRHIEDFYSFLKNERRTRFEMGKYAKSEKISNATLEKYIIILDEVFDALYYGDYVIDKSLIPPIRPSRNKSVLPHATIAGEILKRFLDKKEKRGKKPMESYSKWLDDEEIGAVIQVAGLRDSCIFRLGIETGYRIESILSIDNVPADIARCAVEETTSKTGRTHAAAITSSLAKDIARYINGERADIVSDVGFDCGALFLTSKGKNKGRRLKYSAYYSKLQVIESTVHRKYPKMQNLILHSHACRSTYLDRLIRDNENARAKGRTPISDFQICELMDWASLDSLYNYLNYHRTIHTVPPSAQNFENNLVRRAENDN